MFGRMSDPGANCWAAQANDGYAALEDGSPAADERAGFDAEALGGVAGGHRDDPPSKRHMRRPPARSCGIASHRRE